MRQLLIRLWDWAATWRWYDAILIGGFGLSIAIHEYLLAIICLLICVFSCISILWHRSESRFLYTSGTVAIILGLVFLIYVTVREKEEHPWSHLSPEKATKESKPQVSEHSPAGALSTFKDKDDGEYFVEFGSNQYKVWPNAWSTDKADHRVIAGDSRGRPLIEAYVKDGTICVDAHLFVGGGQQVNVVGDEIEDNQLGWDRNFDDSAVEIVNSAKIPALQIIYRSSHDAEIYGTFQGDDGFVLVATREVVAMNPPMIRAVQGYPLKRLFRYPARLHLGQEIEPSE